MSAYVDRVHTRAKSLNYEGNINVRLESLGRDGKPDYRNTYTLTLSVEEAERFPLGAQFAVEFSRGV